MIAGAEVGGDRDGFIVGEWRNLVQRLFQALPDIAALQVHPPLYVAPDAQLEHGGGHAGEPLGAVLHAAQDFPLAFRQGAQRLTEEQPAIPADRGERRPKIMDGAREERRTVLIVLLQLQIGLDQALQNLVAVGAQRSGNRRPIVVGRNGESQKRRQSRAGDGLQQDMGIDGSAAAKAGQDPCD